MIPNVQTENYNETVLIPILQEKVNALTTQTIVLEAKLQIALKEKAEVQKQLAEAQASQVETPQEVSPTIS
jgi:hypothetical protein